MSETELAEQEEDSKTSGKKTSMTEIGFKSQEVLLCQLLNLMKCSVCHPTLPLEKKKWLL
jgi:hypothetical protein